MKALAIALSVPLVLALGGSGCSRTSAVTPPSPVAEPQEFRYVVSFGNQEGDYSVRLVEYADEAGAVKPVPYARPVWRQTLRLKPGDRLYMRAEVSFDAVLTGGLQIAGPDGFYRSAFCERVDGPGSSVLVIDEFVR